MVIWFKNKQNQTWQRCCLAPAWKNGKPKCATNKEPVTLILEGGHYTWFAPPKKTKVPEAWLRESAIPEAHVLAGAAPKQSRLHATSEATPSVHTMLSKSKDTPSIHTMVGQSTQNGGKTLFRSIPTIGKEPSCSTSAGKRKRLVGKQKVEHEVQGTTDNKVWTCPLCHLRIDAPNTRVLGYRRGNHFKLRHPGIKRPKNSRLRNPFYPVVPSELIPVSERDWTCSLCNKGLGTMLTKAHKDASIREHLAKEHPGVKNFGRLNIKKRWETYRQDKTKEPTLAASQRKRITALKALADARTNGVGHEIVRLEVDWSNIWKQLEIQSKMPQPQERMATCVKCRRFRTGTGSMTQKNSKCPGKFVPWGLQKKAWVRIQAVPDVAEKLIHAWKITKEEADQAFGLLVQQGIEPNPGPGGKGRRNILVVSLNVNGATGAWKALEMLQGHDAIFMQETALKPNDLDAFQRQAHKQGYKTYHCAGSIRMNEKGNQLAQHGVTTLVKADLPHKLLHTSSAKQANRFQTIMIQIGTWMCVNTYTPPRPDQIQQECALEHVNLFQECEVNVHKAWTWVGDFNHELGGPFTQIAAAFGAQPIQGLAGTPTRWNSTRTIDHVYCSKSVLAGEFGALELSISDHKPLKFKLDFDWTEETHRFVMPPRGKWECPEIYSQEKWTELLEATWGKNDATKQLMDRITNHSSQINVEDEWTMFNQCLYDMFRSVHQQLPGTKTLPSREKGSTAKVVLVPKKVNMDSGNMQSRKRLNFIARAKTFMNKSRNSNFIHSKEGQKLSQKLGYRSHAELLQQIEKLQSTEDSYRAETKAQRLKKWRQQMQNDVSARVKWAKKNFEGCQPTVTHNGNPKFKNTEVTQAIRSYWTKVWNEAKKISPLNKSEQLSFIQTCLGPQKATATFGRPTEFDLFQAVHDMSKNGACGTDQWYPSEIKSLPLEVMRVFWTRASWTYS